MAQWSATRRVSCEPLFLCRGGLPGGEQGNHASIGKVIGPSFYADEIPDVITNVINTYVNHRSEDESFIQAYRRLGVAPFKEAAYQNAKKKEKADTKSAGKSV